MKYTAVIFDMDGTIVDTETIWDTATRLLIESKVGKVPEAIMAQVHAQLGGLAVHASCAVIKEQFNLADSVASLVEEKMSFARNLYQAGIKFIPGFVNFHGKVMQHNLKSGIATNANDWTLQTTNYALKLDTFFGQHMYGISCVGNVYKPDPAIYTHAAQQLGVAPTACIAIEDSAHGVTAAQRAGMFCIGINTGKNRSVLAHANHVVDTYEEINLADLLV